MTACFPPHSSEAPGYASLQSSPGAFQKFMLFVGHTGKIQTKIKPCGIVLFASDHDRLLLDKQVPVFVLHEVFLCIKDAHFFLDHGLEGIVARPDTCDAQR